MKIGRNDPCPCGSGRKYKNCCMKKEEADHRWEGMGLPAFDLEAATGVSVWQADIVPVNMRLGDDPTARPAIVLVMAGGQVVFHELLSRPSAEPADMAGELAGGILEAAGAMGSMPVQVQVRHEDVAAALADRLTSRNVEVTATAVMRDIEHCADSMRAYFAGGPDYTVVVRPETWAGWGQPDEWLASLFSAAAEFQRSKPWAYIRNTQVIRTRVPGGGDWFCTVMGSALGEAGLLFYSERSDLLRMIDTWDEALLIKALHGLSGRAVTLLYDEGSNLPRPMLKEVMSAGWEVASPSAYPLLLTANTPAGGITGRDGHDLVQIIRAVAGLAREKGKELGKPGELEWRDPDTGVELSVEGPILYGT